MKATRAGGIAATPAFHIEEEKVHFNTGKTIANGKPSWAKTAQPGDRFGRLAVLREVEATYQGKHRKRRVLCGCECGTEAEVAVSNLLTGHTQSCGCLKPERSHERLTHGGTGTRLHGIWSGMLNRCRNPHDKSYRYYGANGVSVCHEWMSFEPFRDWALTHGYQDDLTIDRIDPFGGYAPDNCRWIPQSEQAATKRSAVSRC